MKGFSLQIGDNITYAALETGSVGMLISNKSGEFTISLNGMDMQGTYYEWYNHKLCIGDSITLKYDSVDESMISKPIFVRDVNDKESEDKLLLDSYDKLRQELLEEGLIAP